MSKIFFFLAMATIFTSFFSCKSSQASRPEEFYGNADLELEPEPSTIQIKIRLHREELVKSINDQLKGPLYEDNNLKDDGMMIKATKRNNISLNIDNQKITYKVPLDLWIKKDLAITDVEGEGSLSLDFTTNYSINPDWSLKTKTELSGFQWLREPIIKLGFANLPITPIANLVLNQTKGDLSKSIDDEVKNMFDLKKEMAAVWQQISEPYLMSEEYNTWLLFNPESMGMTALKSYGSIVEATAVIVSKPYVVVGEKPEVPKAKKMPDFQLINLTEGGDDFNLSLNTEVSFKEAERISKQNMVGETFSSGKKSVKVEDMEIYGQGNKLVVNTKLSGSYNGNIYFIGKPVFNEKKNKIEMQNVEFDFSSQKALMKSASWLFKGTLKKKIQESLDFYLQYNLDDSKAMVQQQLKNYPIANGIILNGLLDDISVSHVYVTTDAIKVRVGLKGKLNVDVKGLR